MLPCYKIPLQTLVICIALILCCVRHNATTGILCEDPHSCQNTSLLIGDSVNCRGYEACLNLINITATANDVECLSTRSCSHTTRITSSNGHVGCYGAYSCSNVKSLSAATISYCYGELSCAKINHLHGLQYVWCTGKASCSNITNSIVAQIGYVECSALESCQHSNAIISQEHALCVGQRSCFNVGNLVSIVSYIYCSADESCMNSTIIGSGTQIECIGARSCKNSIIKNTLEIKAYGYFALENTIIYATGGRPASYNSTQSTVVYSSPSDLKNVTIELYGYWSGYGATIICQGDGIYCKINCRGNGCQNTELISRNNASFVVFCEDSDGATHCPNGYNYSTNTYTSNIPTIHPTYTVTTTNTGIAPTRDMTPTQAPSIPPIALTSTSYSSTSYSTLTGVDTTTAAATTIATVTAAGVNGTNYTVDVETTQRLIISSSTGSTLTAINCEGANSATDAYNVWTGQGSIFVYLLFVLCIVCVLLLFIIGKWYHELKHLRQYKTTTENLQKVALNTVKSDSNFELKKERKNTHDDDDDNDSDQDKNINVQMMALNPDTNITSGKKKTTNSNYNQTKAKRTAGGQKIKSHRLVHSKDEYEINNSNDDEKIDRMRQTNKLREAEASVDSDDSGDENSEEMYDNRTPQDDKHGYGNGKEINENDGVDGPPVPIGYSTYQTEGARSVSIALANENENNNENEDVNQLVNGDHSNDINQEERVIKQTEGNFAHTTKPKKTTKGGE